jgi:hypothetical protein
MVTRRKRFYETVKISEHDIPSNPDEFIALLNKNIDSIVENFDVNRTDINIEIDRDYGYNDSTYIFIGLTYRRLETDEEMSTRVNEKEIEENQKSYLEYEKYLELKKKFE